MSSEHPHLDQNQQRRRERRRRTWIGFGVMVLFIVAAVIALALNAGRWGVPMFGFTNEYGSKCRNDWLGHTCTELTVADVQRHLGVDIPPDARVESGTWRQTHDYELTVRMVYPQPEAEAGWKQLEERFGGCREGLPNPLSAVPGLSAHCLMSNEGVSTAAGDPAPQIWRIATATAPDGSTVVDVYLRSR